MGKVANPKLNDKQERFCHEYLIDCNGTQAYIRAGYSSNSPHVEASNLLNKPNVRTRIRELMDKRSEDTLIDAAFVLEGLKEVAGRCMQAKPVMTFNGKFMEQKKDENGNGVWEFDSTGANKALELIGKHTGFFEKDNKQAAAITIKKVGFTEIDE